MEKIPLKIAKNVGKNQKVEKKVEDKSMTPNGTNLDFLKTLHLQ